MKKKRPSKLWILSLILTLVITSLPAGVMADTGIQANVQTSTDQLSQPGTSKPGQSGTEQPGQPSEPGTDQPSQPGTDQPSQPGTDQPSQPGTDQPSQPGTDQPSQPGTDQPSQPGTEQPGQPQNPLASPSAIPGANLLNAESNLVDVKIFSNPSIKKLDINGKDEYHKELGPFNPKGKSLECPKGEYEYVAYSDLLKKNVAGKGSFDITEDGQCVYLSYITISIATEAGKSISTSLKLTDDQNQMMEPGKLNKPDGQVITFASYVLPALTSDDGSRPYYLTVIPDDENYTAYLKQINTAQGGASGDTSLKIDLKIGNGSIFSPTSSKFQVSATVSQNRPVQFKVPHGAGMQFHLGGPAAYVPYKELTPQIEEGSPYDTYTFKMPADTNVRYEAGGGDSSYLKQVQTFSIPSKYFDNDSVPKFTLDLKKKSERRDPLKLGYEEDNLYLNVPDSNYIKLNENGSFNIEGFRVWQAAEGSVSNQFPEPDCHYDVVAGADNIALEKTGKPGREYMTVTGEKTGISVIRITYDPMRIMASQVKQENGAISLSTDEMEYWNAIDPVNTRVVVVNVGGNNAANIQTNIAQTEYDTIYFDQDQTDHADFTFTPTANAEIKVRVHEPLYDSQTKQWVAWDDKAAWSDYKPNEGGAFTVHLKNGRNIIEVSADDSVEYYVVNAKALKIKTENHSNPGKPLKVGDTEYISFDGLTQPVQKMAAVYNPGWGGTCWVQYEDQDNPNRIFSSEGVQYNLIDANTIAVTPSQPGQLHLVNGRIHAGWMGSPLDAHREISPDGLLPNLNAGGNDRFFSILPDITLDVQSGADGAQLNKTFFAQLKQITLSGSNLDPLASSWRQPTNALWDALGDNRNKFAQVSISHSPTIKLDVSALHSKDLDLELFSRKEGTTSWKEIKGNNQGLSFQFAPEAGQKSTDLELRVTPKNESDGYPQTYAFLLQDPGSSNPEPFLANLKIVPQNGTGDMGYLDGQLKAVSGQNDGLNLGYGFLPTRDEFTTEVPYQVSEMTVKALIPNNYRNQSISLTVSGSSQTLPPVNAEYESESTSIPLTVGDNSIQVTAQSTLPGGSSATYTIHVVRRAAPALYTFTNRKEGTTLVVKSDRGYVMEPEAENPNQYLLNAGTYTYYYSQIGYVAQSGTITAGSEAANIPLGDLSPLDQKDGTVTVQITSPNSLLRGKTSIAYTVNGAKDLAAQGYVEYNHGGYTALHAILSACDTGINKIKFSCYQGNLKLSDIAVPSDAGENAGWVCEINGQTCTDLANTLVKDGDQISYYYNPDYAGMQHASFKQEDVTVTAGAPASVTLLGAPVNNNGSPAVPISGATVKLNGQDLDGTTDAGGTMDIPSSKLENPGVYTVTAEKTEDGHNILTYCRTMITVKKADVPVTPGKTTVRFRLIGDAKHGSFATHEKYVTWIATKKYTFNSDSVSVYDVFTKALSDAGLAYVGAENNYVSKIKAPKAYGDYWLGEFDNGPNSGWMYTVNGVHPGVGLKDFKVTNGDSIIWHYVDDYKKETSFEGSHPEYENRWLEAPDVNPPTDGTIIDMSQGNAGVEPNAATATVETEAKTDSSGKASASISSKDLSDALKKALEQADKNNKDLAIVRVNVKADSGASTVEAVISASGWKEIQKAGNALLVIATPIGEMKFDHDALAAAAKEMNGQDLSLSITKTQAKALPENIRSAVQDTVGDRPLYQLSLNSGDKAITSFGSGTVTVTLPYELQKDEKAEGVCVYYIDDKAKAQLIPDGEYLSQSKTAHFTTNHFSWYGIGYSQAKAKGLTGISRFTDVSLNDWFAASVSQLVELGIIKGKTDTEFAPQDNVTRAEFAQILYKMAQKDSQTTGSAISGAAIKGEGAKAAEAFCDVKADAWYGESVAWAYDAGIIAGYNNGDGTQSFAPNTKISRQDMAVMLMNYTVKIRKKELPKIKATMDFVDQDQISSYASSAVTLMQRAGVISGKVMADQTLFAPKDHATRAEAAQMVAAYINLK